MNFPNLLYFVSPETQPVSPEVFGDLQLFHFIPEKIALACARPCNAENIRERQRFFESLSEPQVRQALEKAESSLAKVCALDGIYNECRCDREKDFVYAALIRAELDFGGLASEFPSDCPLAKRFSDFFRSVSAEAGKNGLREALDALEGSLDDPKNNIFTTHKKTVTVRRGKNKTYIAKIAKCAEELGLPGIDETDSVPEQLSPRVIDALYRLYPDSFAKAAAFRKEFGSFYDPKITEYEPQLGFYSAFLSLCDRVNEAGIPLTYPEIAEDEHVFSLSEVYDISLLAKDEKHIVPNDIFFTEKEPFFYLTGANGGGKTTYLRTVGIAALLFVNGCPVPCRGGKISPFDGIFSHFPHDERFEGTGRFVEEQNRVKEILARATGNSLVLLNETYSSTNEENAVLHTQKLAGQLSSSGIFGLYITHQHSLSDDGIPYLNVMIDSADANRRTYKIARQKNTGGSFARDILVKYRLTPEALAERFGGAE